MTWLSIGRFGRAHGVRGELRFWPYNAASQTLKVGLSLRVGQPQSEQSVTISALRFDAKGPVVRLAEIAQREALMPLAGRDAFMPRAQLPQAADDEVYLVDLLGLPVRTVEGRAVGRLHDVLDAGGRQIFVIRDGSKEYLVPNVDPFIERLDPADGEIVIRPIEGLLEPR